MSINKVGAIVVTYNPEIERFHEVIKSILNQIDYLVIVDNNSKNIDDIINLFKNYENIEIIRNEKNYGIGKALNIGVEKLKNKVNWILTLDQDSIVLKNIKEIFSNLNESNLKNSININQIGIISLSYIDYQKKNDGFFFINKNPIIISGSIINTNIFENGTRFREEFFLDHTDTDFDFKVKYIGYLILTTVEKYIDHNLGEIIELKNGEKIKFEPEWRVYLITRNLFKLLMENKIKLNFFINQLLIWDYSLIKARGIKDGLIAVYKTNLFGIIDSLRNKFGPIDNRHFKNFSLL